MIARMRVYTRFMSSACYCTLLRSAARKATAIYDQALESAGITIGQFRLLRILEREGPHSLTELGRLTGLDRSTVGRNIRLLQRMGMVRPSSGTDQREAAVELDAGGRQALEAAAPLWACAQERIEASLGRDAEARLHSLLQAL